VHKNFKELAKMVKGNKEYREKFFIAECNLSKNIELENKYFLGQMPKVYYFSAFENMRKRKFERITTPHLVLKFLLSLKQQEPKIFTQDMDFNMTMKQINEHHMILGLFPNGKDETYKNQFIEVSNKYSHLPFYACFKPKNFTMRFNLPENKTSVIIFRKPELRPSDKPEFLVWNTSESLMDFVEGNYHLPVDIYTHDSKPLYDLHADDVGLLYFAGANTLYHQSFSSPVVSLLSVLQRINIRLLDSSKNFTSDEAKTRYSRFSLGLAFKSEFWIWARKLHMKMKMDYSEEFSPIVRDSRGRFYMRTELANMTLDSIDEDKIFQFYFDYIQGDVHEFKKSEDLSESYIIGKTWKRRLHQDPERVVDHLKNDKLGMC
jgi:hypothetical protein